jgi:hypothetical protein
MIDFLPYVVLGISREPDSIVIWDAMKNDKSGRTNNVRYLPPESLHFPTSADGSLHPEMKPWD